MPDITVETGPYKIGIECIACGKMIVEEYFCGNISIMICDECKQAIRFAKKLRKMQKEWSRINEEEDIQTSSKQTVPGD